MEAMGLPSDVATACVLPWLREFWLEDRLTVALASKQRRIHAADGSLTFFPLCYVYRTIPDEHFPYGEQLLAVRHQREVLYVPWWFWRDALAERIERATEADTAFAGPTISLGAVAMGLLAVALAAGWCWTTIVYSGVP